MLLKAKRQMAGQRLEILELAKQPEENMFLLRLVEVQVVLGVNPSPLWLKGPVMVVDVDLEETETKIPFVLRTFLKTLPKLIYRNCFNLSEGLVECIWLRIKKLCNLGDSLSSLLCTEMMQLKQWIGYKVMVMIT